MLSGSGVGVGSGVGSGVISGVAVGVAVGTGDTSGEAEVPGAAGAVLSPGTGDGDAWPPVHDERITAKTKIKAKGMFFLIFSNLSAFAPLRGHEYI